MKCDISFKRFELGIVAESSEGLVEAQCFVDVAAI